MCLSVESVKSIEPLMSFDDWTSVKGLTNVACILCLFPRRPMASTSQTSLLVSLRLSSLMAVAAPTMLLQAPPLLNHFRLCLWRMTKYHPSSDGLWRWGWLQSIEEPPLLMHCGTMILLFYQVLCAWLTSICGSMIKQCRGWGLWWTFTFPETEKIWEQGTLRESLVFHKGLTSYRPVLIPPPGLPWEAVQSSLLQLVEETLEKTHI